MPYPSTVSTFVNPLANNKLNAPSHSSIETAQNTGLTEIQTFLGTNSSVQGTVLFDVRSPLSDGGGHVQTAVKGGTGQTTFTKGDLLVATSASVISKLAVGVTDGQVLIVNSAAATGVSWGAGAVPTAVVYAGSVTGIGGSSFVGIWYKPSTLSYAVIETVGGGGGGAGTTNNGVTVGGGGGGGYSKKTVVYASLPLAASILIGRGGTQGNGTGGNGSVGGISYFGSVISATGGIGGTSDAGGGGGLGTGGDINTGGGSGQQGSSSDVGIKLGGNSFYGGGGGGHVSSMTGRSYGGGGGGAWSAGGSDTEGGHGADGIVIITQY